MTPPDLPRDAPGLDAAHPFKEGVPPASGHEPSASLLNRFDRFLGEFCGAHKPLICKERLDDDSRSITVRNRARLWLNFFEKPPFFESPDNQFARNKSI